MVQDPMLIDVTGSMTAAFDDHEDAVTAAERLADAGWDLEGVQLLAGPEGLKRLDASGKRHGILGRVIRALQQLGDELKFLAGYAEALRRGAVVLVVPIDDDARKDEAHAILADAGGHEIVHFGSVTMEELEEPPPSDTVPEGTARS